MAIRLRTKSEIWATFGAAASSIGFCFLLLMKISWHIWDTGCPTFTLNMINQIRNGKFPASFPGAPDVSANYHQGHLLVSATVGNLLRIDSLNALRLCILFFSVMGFFLLSKAYSRVFGTTLGLVIILLFYLISSFPNAQTWPLNPNVLGPYEYLSLFEYLVSPSWPIAILICIMVFTNICDSNQTKSRVAILLIVLPFFNATLFTVIFATYFLYLTVELRSQIKKRSNIKVTFLYLLFTTSIYFLKNYTLSAFRGGRDYESPKIGLRLFQENWLDFTFSYLNLQTPLILIGIVVSIKILLKPSDLNFYAYLFLIGLVFPVLFEIQGVNFWDNAHKFVITSSFTTIIIVLKYYEKYPIPSKRMLFLIFISLTILNASSQFNDIKTRWQGNIVDSLQIEEPSRLSNYLNGIDGQKMVWLYRKEKLDICDPFTKVINQTDVAAAGFYASTFLLSPERESRVLNDSVFYKILPIETLKNNSRYNHIVVVPEKMDKHFQTEPEFVKSKFIFERNVDNFRIYHFILTAP